MFGVVVKEVDVLGEEEGGRGCCVLGGREDVYEKKREEGEVAERRQGEESERRERTGRGEGGDRKGTGRRHRGDRERTGRGQRV